MRAHHLAWLAFLAGACSESVAVPEFPTWADVEPILRRNCNYCHGSTAALTGSQGQAVYRFDFFDPKDGACGEAAAALDIPGMALASAPHIKDSIASINGARPRMPPAPAPLLADWEQDTLYRWSHASAPPKGTAPWENRQPRLQIINFPAKADGVVRFSAILSDPDGDPVIGIIKAPSSLVKLDRPGAFSVSLNSSGWQRGQQRLTAILCDGWGNATFAVGEVEISHAP